MTVTSDQIRRTVVSYLDDYPEESEALLPMTSLLEAGIDVTVCAESRGHATASAVMVNRTGEVLHVHHAELGVMYLPGGHLELGDGSLRYAALRALVSATGIDASQIASGGIGPVQVTVRGAHFDFRFLFATAANVAVCSSTWLPVEALPEPLRGRVRELLVEPLSEPVG